MAGKIDSLVALEEKMTVIINYLDDALQGRRKVDSKILEGL